MEIHLRDKLYLERPPDNIMAQIDDALTIYRKATRDQAEYKKILRNYTYVFDKGMYIELPRGFLTMLLEGLNAHGIQTTLIDERRTNTDKWYEGAKVPKLRSHQADAVQQILDRKSGVVVAPPGAGKTVLMLEAMRRSGQKALVIVDKKNLIDQWADRCKEFLGFYPAIIAGETTGYPRATSTAITIAMQQTLASRIENQYNLGAYGFVCLDECHHVSANTYMDVFERFNSLYRVGLSATPYRDDGLDLISKMVIGPMIYNISHEELLNAKHLVKPEIVRVKTSFQHDFWGTHGVTKDMVCDKPGCKKNGRSHSHRNNYMTVTKALVEDRQRNMLIASVVESNKDKCNLIVSDRLQHLEDLRELCIHLGFPEERTYMLTGKEKPPERAEVSKLAGYGACAIFSTIAKEALDIPRLDRIYLTWPVKRDHILEQQIGRIARTHPDKSEAVCYDFWDEGCTVLSGQSYSRFNYYRTKNYTIIET